MQTSFVDTFNKRQKDKRPSFSQMFSKYLKRKSFIHLLAFYIFKFLKKKSHLFTYLLFMLFFLVCKFLHKKKMFEIPLIASYTLLLLKLRFNIFLQPSTCHTTKTNCVKFWTVDPEICSIFIFQKIVWEQFSTTFCV